MSGLFALAYDSSSDVRKVVCTGLVQMLHLQQQRLQPHMKEIIEYMLQATQVRISTSQHQHQLDSIIHAANSLDNIMAERLALQ